MLLRVKQRYIPDNQGEDPEDIYDAFTDEEDDHVENEAAVPPPLSSRTTSKRSEFESGFEDGNITSTDDSDEVGDYEKPIELPGRADADVLRPPPKGFGKKALPAPPPARNTKAYSRQPSSISSHSSEMEEDIPPDLPPPRPEKKTMPGLASRRAGPAQSPSTGLGRPPLNEPTRAPLTEPPRPPLIRPPPTEPMRPPVTEPPRPPVSEPFRPPHQTLPRDQPRDQPRIPRGTLPHDQSRDQSRVDKAPALPGRGQRKAATPTPSSEKLKKAIMERGISKTDKFERRPSDTNNVTPGDRPPMELPPAARRPSGSSARPPAALPAVSLRENSMKPLQQYHSPDEGQWSPLSSCHSSTRGSGDSDPIDDLYVPIDDIEEDMMPNNDDTQEDYAEPDLSTIPPSRPLPTPPQLNPPKLIPPKLNPPKLNPPKLNPPQLNPPKLNPPQLNTPQINPASSNKVKLPGSAKGIDIGPDTLRGALDGLKKSDKVRPQLNKMHQVDSPKQQKQKEPGPPILTPVSASRLRKGSLPISPIPDAAAQQPLEVVMPDTLSEPEELSPPPHTSPIGRPLPSIPPDLRPPPVLLATPPKITDPPPELIRELRLPIPRPESKNIKDHGWYYHSESREDCEAELRHCESGHFIVRKNTKQGRSKNPYVLSLLYHRRFWHLHMRLRDDKKYALGLYKSGERTFLNVPEMIEYYKHEQLFLSGEDGGTVILTTHPRDK